MGLFIEQKRNRMPEGIKIIKDEYNKKLAMYGYTASFRCIVRFPELPGRYSEIARQSLQNVYRNRYLLPYKPFAKVFQLKKTPIMSDWKSSRDRKNDGRAKHV